MKGIAFLSLQKLPGDDAMPADMASDQPLEDEGFAKLRGSMHSVLDDESLDFRDEAEESISSSVGKLDLEDKDTRKLMELHAAVRRNNTLSVKALIDEGADLLSTANDGKTILHYASMALDIDIGIMGLLLESGARESINFKDGDGQAPLHYAAKIGFAHGIIL
ncbi:hypothetical protein O1611_g4405 [Lasiodiplodia mahajangana]|uniref:Uncharacterized protein n=1 Tax=Lasiodiplodia mahajangana TaxID=1108764 RepID=A0ACC2JP12_9PEZI|nr:hypothetical protein O1611_g4405 [Lasiodiplodia mahajangana]